MSTLDRLRRVNPVLIDSVVVMVVLAVAVAFTGWADGGRALGLRAPNLLTSLLVALQSIPLLLRRRMPVVALAIVGSAYAIYPVFHFGFEGPFVLIVLFALYTAASRTERNPALLAAVVGGAVALGRSIAVGFDFDAFLSELILFEAVWAIGRTVRARRLQRIHEREEAAVRAVAEERVRIARELHDIVAHSIGVMVVQAGAARSVVKTDSEKAAEALAKIEATGRTGLAEMRRLLGILRANGERELSPQPGLNELADLVQQMRDTGLEVDLEISGELQTLPAGVDLSAYRIVQEALTNTLKHSRATRSRVRITYTSDAVEVDVLDNGEGAKEGDRGDGQGLIGMRERIALLGGKLDVSSEPIGYRVRARLPIGGER